MQLDIQRVRRYLRNTLRERRDTCVTTFFDLYGLPANFPGCSDAPSPGDPLNRARHIEAELHRQVVHDAGCRPERFVPHVQPHEFEALLFSDVKAFEDGGTPRGGDGPPGSPKCVCGSAVPSTSMTDPILIPPLGFGS